jgi:predicted porin
MEPNAGQRVLLPAPNEDNRRHYMSKTTTRLVFATVASTLALSATAMAADLGGNCCADLEERVAELEATAARKGNRKVSLTVYGHVNEAVIFWNDGQERNAYVVSNNAARTRFGFRGDAKVTEDVTLGYNLEVGVRYANSQTRNQTASGAGGGNNADARGLSAPGPLDVRQSFWYLDSKHLGRVSVGKQNSASEGITEINLANINATAFDINNTNGAFFLRNNGTLRSGVTWSNLQSPFSANIDGDRSNVVKYTSPAFAGFTASASWGEDDRQDAALRYAGEFNGVRLAAGIGYQKMTDFNPTADGGAACANPGSAVAPVAAGSLTPQVTISNTNCEVLGMSASVMHVPTGIFLTGGYSQSKDKNLGALAPVNVNPTTVAPAAFAGAVDDKNKAFIIMGGIEQKWFSIGKSTLYGEYIKSNTGNALSGGQLRTLGAGDALAPGCAANACFISSSEVKTWGIGFNQEIVAAAADMYIAFRNTSGSLHTVNAQGGAIANTGVKDFQSLTTGMIIRF